jgi:hypothetical protein
MQRHPPPRTHLPYIYIHACADVPGNYPRKYGNAKDVLTRCLQSTIGQTSPTSGEQKAADQSRRKRRSVMSHARVLKHKNNGVIEEKEDERDVAVHASPQVSTRAVRKQTSEDQKQKTRRPRELHDILSKPRSEVYRLVVMARVCGSSATERQARLPVKDYHQ